MSLHLTEEAAQGKATERTLAGRLGSTWGVRRRWFLLWETFER